MKNILACLLVLTLCGGVNAEPLKIVYHLNEMEKAQMAISSINEILKSNPDVDIKAVLQGPAIIRLAKGDGLNSEFISLIEQGVEVSACSNSMLKQKLEPSIMIDGVVFLLQGGVQRIIELQQQGYIYIKI